LGTLTADLAGAMAWVAKEDWAKNMPWIGSLF
jgi:hypothetical protein